MAFLQVEQKVVHLVSSLVDNSAYSKVVLLVSHLVDSWADLKAVL